METLRIITTLLNELYRWLPMPTVELLGQGYSYCSVISLSPFIEGTVMISV